MRIRLAALLTVLLLPVATASASLSSPPQPEKKCPLSMSFIFDHCD